VSKRSGLASSVLSKLETGKMALTYDKLMRLSGSLGVDISELLAEQGETGVVMSGRRSVTRKGEGMKVEAANYNNTYPAADLLHKKIIPIIGDVKVRSIEEFGEMISHPGEEFAYIVEGEVDLYTEIYQPLRLKAGDSVYFDSTTKHAYIAVGDGPCKMLSICTNVEPQFTTVRSRTRASAAVESPVNGTETAEPGKAGKRIRSKRPA
jgi:mannose-6-phosphate isomerase-like protein (cupin superfamily)